MKAERRHDLKTNALARGLEGFPYYWRTYGSQALLVVLIFLIVFMLVRYWNEKKARQFGRKKVQVKVVKRGGETP